MGPPVLVKTCGGHAVDRHSQRAAWCPGRLVSALMFTPCEHLCLRVKWLDNHSQDHGRSQVHMWQTTREQLLQQRFYIYRLTPVKCPHLLSHEMAGQVDSGALDQFLSLPHVVSYPAVVSSCSAELCFVLGRIGCDTVFALPATLSTASSLDSTPTNGRRISRQTSHTVHKEIGTTLNTGLSKTSRVQFASGNTLHISLANCYTSWMFMSCSTFNLKSCSQTGLICIFTESVTLSKQIATTGTQVSNGTKESTTSFC